MVRFGLPALLAAVLVLTLVGPPLAPAARAQDGTPEPIVVVDPPEAFDPAPSAPEGGFGALTILARVCPPLPVGADPSPEFFDACGPLADGAFYAVDATLADAPAETAVTDAGGSARFTLPAGPILFYYEEGPGGDNGLQAADCANSGGPVAAPVSDDGFLRLDLVGADVTVCDYTFIPYGDGSALPDGFFDSIFADAAARLGVDPSAPVVDLVEPRDWSDGSLGCPQPGQAYTDALVPGYLVVLSAAETTLEYHTDRTGSWFVRCDGAPAAGLRAVPGAVPIAQVRTADAALTVHARLCPIEYPGTDYYGACHDTPVPEGITLFLEGPNLAETALDAAGNASFTGLPAGTYTVTLDVPYDFIDRQAVFCAPAATPGTRFPAEDLGYGLRVALAATDRVVCDFYLVGDDARGPGPSPGSADLTIHNRVCPPGASPATLYRDCHDSPAPAGLEFTATGPVARTVQTDAAGNAVFAALPAGTYTLRGGVPGEFAELRVFCAPADAPGTPFPFTPLLGGTRGPQDPTGVRLALAPGDTVLCDWYNLPEDLRGSTAPAFIDHRQAA